MSFPWCIVKYIVKYKKVSRMKNQKSSIFSHYLDNYVRFWFQYLFGCYTLTLFIICLIKPIQKKRIWTEQKNKLCSSRGKAAVWLVYTLQWRLLNLPPTDYVNSDCLIISKMWYKVKVLPLLVQPAHSDSNRWMLSRRIYQISIA